VAGKMSLPQRCHHENPRQLRTLPEFTAETALLPAMTLKRMYHCVPSSSSTTELDPQGRCRTPHRTHDHGKKSSARENSPPSG